MSNDINETAAKGRKNPDNDIVDVTEIMTGDDARGFVRVDSGNRATTYEINLDVIGAAFGANLIRAQLDFFGNAGPKGSDGRVTLELLKSFEATNDNKNESEDFNDDDGGRYRLELFAEDNAGEVIAADDFVALVAAAIAGEADLDFFETDTGFDIHIGGRWSTDILRFEGETALQLAEDLQTPVNTKPDAEDDSRTVIQGFGSAASAPGILGNDTDAEGDDLTIIAVNGDAANVGVAQSGAGGLTYTILDNGGFSLFSSDKSLGEGESVTETITYTISDGNGGTDTASFVVTIQGINDAPDAVDDAFTVAAGETTANLFDLIFANDFDPDGDDFQLTDITDVSVPDGLGSFEFNIGGSTDTIQFTANPGQSGTASFQYEITDDFGATDTATVTVEIEAADTGTEVLIDFESVGTESDPGLFFFESGGTIEGFTWEATAGQFLSMSFRDWEAGGLPQVSDDYEATTRTNTEWSISRGGDSFDFVSGEFASGQFLGSEVFTGADNVTVVGLRNGQEEFSQVVALSATEMTSVVFNFTDIDELAFVDAGGNSIAPSYSFDDLLFVV